MKNNRSMPTATVIPVLAYANVAAATKWLCEIFGFHEHLRIGNHRVQLTIGSGSVVVSATQDPSAAGESSSKHSTMVRITEIDAHFDHARSAGARILSPPMSYPYGERQYTVEDLGGHIWTFSESIIDMHPSEWGGELLNDHRILTSASTVGYEGGCYCGAIRYRISGPPVASMVCHCQSCRRIAAAPLVPWITVAKAQFALLRGALIAFSSSPPVRREFCSSCGTQINYCHADELATLDVTTCTLDNADLFPPTHHSWVSHDLGWIKEGHELPRFTESRSHVTV